LAANGPRATTSWFSPDAHGIGRFGDEHLDDCVLKRGGDIGFVLVARFSRLAASVLAVSIPKAEIQIAAGNHGPRQFESLRISGIGKVGESRPAG